ncbi:uncharacterized protein V1510DRAFT_392311 [Dipodascopsis tothii]|uniref:uncharacterized protein n=1 Tax=Dipodascopsis tothii TaxID=44089 RepID=UPI0034CE1698
MFYARLGAAVLGVWGGGILLLIVTPLMLSAYVGDQFDPPPADFSELQKNLYRFCAYTELEQIKPAVRKQRLDMVMRSLLKAEGVAVGADPFADEPLPFADKSADWRAGYAALYAAYGRMLADQDDAAGAEAAYRKALAIDSESFDVRTSRTYAGLGRLLDAKGLAAEAEHMFKLAIAAATPAADRAAAGFESVHAGAGHADALAVMPAASVPSTEFFDAAVGLGLVYMKSGQTEKPLAIALAALRVLTARDAARAAGGTEYAGLRPRLCQEAALRYYISELLVSVGRADDAAQWAQKAYDQAAPLSEIKRECADCARFACLNRAKLLQKRDPAAAAAAAAAADAVVTPAKDRTPGLSRLFGYEY